MSRERSRCARPAAPPLMRLRLLRRRVGAGLSHPSGHSFEDPRVLLEAARWKELLEMGGGRGKRRFREIMGWKGP